MPEREIKITGAGAVGLLTYDSENPRGFVVDHPDPDLSAEVRRFLTTRRRYMIPESNRIDDFRTDHVLPVSSEQYLLLALSEMAAEIGVEWAPIP